MKNEEKMWKMMKMQQILVLESMAVSLFAMVLIFGLGFVFPTVNPYIVIKWIIIVAGSVFVYSVLSYLFGAFKMLKKFKKGSKK